MFMNRTLALVLLIAGGARPIWACDCDGPRPSRGTSGADAIFLGGVEFTNEFSGTFLQATLVRFNIEEVFKGLPQGTSRRGSSSRVRPTAPRRWPRSPARTRTALSSEEPEL